MEVRGTSRAKKKWREAFDISHFSTNREARAAGAKQPLGTERQSLKYLKQMPCEWRRLFSVNI